MAHEAVDRKTSSTRRGELLSLPVYSDTLGIAGKIDVYKTEGCRLIERKCFMGRNSLPSYPTFSF